MRVNVTVINPPGVDEYGDPIPGSGTEVTYEDVIVAPRVGGPGTASSEIHGRGRNGVIEGLTAYLPPDAVVKFTSQIKVHHPAHEDHVFEVEGEPGVWESPFTSVEHGLEVALRRAQG